MAVEAGAGTGVGAGGAMPDIERSGVLILWGYNPSFTRLARQLVVPEFVYIAGFTLTRDLFQNRTRKDFGAKHRGHFFLSDLINKSLDLSWARIRKI